MNPGKDAGNDHQHRLNPSADVPKFEVMRGRMLVGLGLGVTGVLLGLIGTIASVYPLVVLAAICAIGGCVTIAGTTLLAILRSPSAQKNDRSPTHSSGRVDIDAPVPLSGAAVDRSVIDAVTELPDARFFDVAVEGRVAAARRHLWPVSIVLVQLGFDAQGGSSELRDKSLTSFSALMRQTLREADIACRLSEDTFGLILEDTSEEGGVWTAERLQIALSHESTSIRRLVAGVAAYPTHGLFAKDVLLRAQAALQRASATPTGHGLGQVEVAHVDLG